jgi:hypothetical protein
LEPSPAAIGLRQTTPVKSQPDRLRLFPLAHVK